jgi:hypothetical protein
LPNESSPQSSSSTLQKEEQKVLISFSQLQKMLVNDLNNQANNWDKDSVIFAKYSKDQIINLLNQPYKHEKDLRNLARFLYINSPHFRQLILYFSNMLTFDYYVEPYGIADTIKVKATTFKAQYQDVLNMLDTINLKHEMVKIMRIVMREDIFYGYELRTDDSYYIMKIDPTLCAVSSIEDGVRNFSFDFSFFDRNTKYLEKYPKEFQTKYKLYKNDKTGMRWQELNSDYTVCFKFNEDLDYNFPPFAQVIESIFDLNDARLREQLSYKMSNYKLLGLKIPMSTTEPDKPMLNFDDAIKFYNQILQSLPDEVGVALSPMDIETIDLDRKNGSGNTIYSAAEQTQKNFYSDAGVSQFLFSNDNATSTGVSSSIGVDEQMMFSFLRQIERWLNRKIKKTSKTFKFRSRFLDMTHNNASDVQKSYLDAAQYGLPISPLAASYGYSPSSFVNTLYLENDVLGLKDKLVPLQSSHTQSANDSGGRPATDPNNLTPSGQKTKEKDGNIRNN